MLIAAFWLFTAVVLLGGALSLYPLGIFATRLLRVGIGHGLLGAAAFAMLIAALRNSATGTHAAAQGFAGYTIVLAALALAIGIIVFLHRKKAPAGWIVGAHATLGIAAYVFLLAYVTLG